jgi:hypothetical protein
LRLAETRQQPQTGGITMDLKRLDEEVIGMVIESLFTDKKGCSVKLDDDLVDKLEVLCTRYGQGFKSVFINKILRNAIDQIEVEFDLDLSKGVNVK